MSNSQTILAAADAGTVACMPMRDPQRLETTIQALLVKRATSAMAIGSEYDDAAIEIALYRADRCDEKAMSLARAGEGLLCRLDDMRDNDDAEWQDAADAVDPFIL